MTRVGWVGLGAMGGPMAVVAAKAHTVVAYDINPEVGSRLAASGVAAAPSIADVATGADVLAVMVATEAQAEAALFGPGGAALYLSPTAVVMVMGTVGPVPVRAWGERLAALSVGLVDAPVSGGVARAASGDLLMMVSGSSSDVAAVATLRDALASRAPLVGEVPGEGQKVKLVNQLLCGVHIAAAGEALAFARALGLDAKDCWEIIRHGAAASFMLDDRGERMLDEAFDVPRSAMDIFVKDMGLVVDAAEQAGAWVPIAATAGELFRRGHDQGLGRKDDSAIISVLARGDS
ncbi:NAD(P)-dependent oxidoreductase [Leifsonia kafniensis]|uniref:NAD(P)-dependent oxidoreductase n=1 Tax=Leifsonia kafniensis TaxID=475957 RepID=A0ABP7KH83_9MICO